MNSQTHNGALQCVHMAFPSRQKSALTPSSMLHRNWLPCEEEAAPKLDPWVGVQVQGRQRDSDGSTAIGAAKGAHFLLLKLSSQFTEWFARRKRSYIPFFCRNRSPNCWKRRGTVTRCSGLRELFRHTGSLRDGAQNLAIAHQLASFV